MNIVIECIFYGDKRNVTPHSPLSSNATSARQLWHPKTHPCIEANQYHPANLNVQSVKNYFLKVELMYHSTDLCQENHTIGESIVCVGGIQYRLVFLVISNRVLRI